MDDFWSLDILDLKDYGPENNRNNRFVFVVIDNFSKFGWTVPLRIKNAITTKDSSKNVLITSKRKTNLIETDEGSDFVNKIFTNLLNNNNIKRCSRNTSLGAVFAERFNRSFRKLLKKPFFQTGNGNWVDILATITKQYNVRIHYSTKLTPPQASLKNNEGYIYHNLLDKRKKIKPK